MNKTNTTEAPDPALDMPGYAFLPANRDSPDLQTVGNSIQSAMVNALLLYAKIGVREGTKFEVIKGAFDQMLVSTGSGVLVTVAVRIIEVHTPNRH